MARNEATSISDMDPHAADEARLEAEAEADCATGRVVAHKRVRIWLAKLAKGEKVPPPEV